MVRVLKTMLAAFIFVAALLMLVLVAIASPPATIVLIAIFMLVAYSYRRAKSRKPEGTVTSGRHAEPSVPQPAWGARDVMASVSLRRSATRRAISVPVHSGWATYYIPVPPYVTDGQVIRAKGRGREGDPAGDLYVTIRISRTPLMVLLGRRYLPPTKIIHLAPPPERPTQEQVLPDGRVITVTQPPMDQFTLQTRHGVTEALLYIQGGVCAGCPDSSSQFVIDHDHFTGLVRGLLCRGCNASEGHDRGGGRWAWYRERNPGMQLPHPVYYDGLRGSTHPRCTLRPSGYSGHSWFVDDDPLLHPGAYIGEGAYGAQGHLPVRHLQTFVTVFSLLTLVTGIAPLWLACTIYLMGSLMAWLASPERSGAWPGALSKQAP